MARRVSPRAPTSCKLWGVTVALGVFLLCWLTGLVGSLVPLFPGALVVLGGIVAATFLQGFRSADLPFLIGASLIIIFISLLDNFTAAWGARRYGGGRAGMWGAVIGGVAGAFLPLAPLLGVMVRPLLGAFVAEWLLGRSPAEALRAAWGTLLGLLTGAAARFTLLFLLGVYEVWRLWPTAGSV